jgi:hypothetical protein
MLPQHLVGEESHSRVVCLDTGQTGNLRLKVVYQARGRSQNRTSLFMASFTPDDTYQQWDEEDQDYNRVTVVAEFKTQEELDSYVARQYKEA